MPGLYANVAPAESEHVPLHAHPWETPIGFTVMRGVLAMLSVLALGCEHDRGTPSDEATHWLPGNCGVCADTECANEEKACSGNCVSFASCLARCGSLGATDC